MKKVIFLIGGVGLGNSTRCHKLIEWLNNLNYSIVIMSSGNGIEYFSNKSNYEIIKIDQIEYEKNNNKLSIIKSLLKIRLLYKIVKKNSKIINTKIAILNPDLIISDSVYFIPDKNFKKKNTVALNNANLVLKYFFRLKNKPLKILPQLFIELIDYLISRAF